MEPASASVKRFTVPRAVRSDVRVRVLRDRSGAGCGEHRPPGREETVDRLGNRDRRTDDPPACLVEPLGDEPAFLRKHEVIGICCLPAVHDRWAWVSATVSFLNVPWTSVTTTPAACVGVVVIQRVYTVRTGRNMDALSTLLFDVAPLDGVTIGGVAALLETAALAASPGPVSRAVDPVVALRADF